MFDRARGRIWDSCPCFIIFWRYVYIWLKGFWMAAFICLFFYSQYFPWSKALHLFQLSVYYAAQQCFPVFSRLTVLICCFENIFHNLWRLMLAVVQSSLSREVRKQWCTEDSPSVFIFSLLLCLSLFLVCTHTDMHAHSIDIGSSAGIYAQGSVFSLLRLFISSCA